MGNVASGINLYISPIFGLLWPFVSPSTTFSLKKYIIGGLTLSSHEKKEENGRGSISGEEIVAIIRYVEVERWNHTRKGKS